MTATATTMGDLAGPARDFGRGEVVHDVIADRVRRTPWAVVAEHDGAVLTYGQLDELSAALAGRLRGLGVALEGRVAVIAPPSREILVAAVGVMRAGAAWVPIDPDYPPDRIALLLADCAPDAIVCTAAVADRVPGSAPPVVIVDADAEPSLTAVTAAVDPSAPAVDPANAACVIYTSGSTSSPKGVVITHRGLVNLALLAADRFALRPGHRFLQLASVSFSAFLEEVFPSVLTGATVVFAGYRKAMRSIPGFLQIVRDSGASAFGITTAYWQELVEQLDESRQHLPATVRMVLMGGEAVRADAVARWPRLGVALVHVYGPTEATATATYFHSGEHDQGLLLAGQLPIGSPVANMTVRLLDERLVPVTGGEPGEVYIAGIGLARGYHAAPGATASRFVPDPYGPPGTRMYRTGDLAARREDGNLEFLGRIGTGSAAEVKLRGVRFQPAEVEAVLESHPGVRRAVAQVRQVGARRQALVAYLVAQSEQVPSVSALREHAAARLPDALVPARFVVVDRIPLSANGKTDYAALPEPDLSRPAIDTPWVEPQSQTQRRVAEVWSQVLGVASPGAHDSFLELGGDSLAATRVLARLGDIFGIRLRVGDTLRAGTVQALARLIDEQRAAGIEAHDDLPQARRRAQLVANALRDRAAPPGANMLSVSQQGLWVLHRLSPENPRYNVAIRLRLTGAVDVTRLADAVARASVRHQALGSVFTTVDGYALQVFPPVGAGAVTLRPVDLRGLDPAVRVAEADRLITEEAAAPFDLAAGPVCRMSLHLLGDDEFELTIQAHHLVFDGWSARVLLDDILAEYDGRGAPAPELSYADFAALQRERLRGEHLERLERYWAKALAQAPQRIELSQRQRPNTFDRAGESIRMPLDPQLLGALTALGHEEDATLFMVALAGFSVMLHRHSGATDLPIGTPFANRPGAGFDRVVGFFVNTIVLRADLHGEPSYRDVIRRVRATCLDGYEHGELPFDLLVERLAPPRQRGENPLFQVVFSLDSAPGASSHTPGVILHQGRLVETGSAMFDLTWLVELQPGGGVVVAAEFDSALLRVDEVAAMVATYQEVLRSMTAQPDRPITASIDRDEAGLSAADEADAIERVLGAMWSEAFDGAAVGPHDDFFEIGGYSLLASQLCARIGERLGVRIELRTFFESPTIAALAERVRQQRAAEPSPQPSLSEPAGAGPSLRALLDEIESLSDDDVVAAANSADTTPAPPARSEVVIP
ncbi:amino acid adenylation domain-containing protein [Dactylosporangium sp. NPDC051484]|uniref:amino acid adenylation domain-containing protein n=1 Tax=Dactylosporangium sp. NPDC051484 TaxID=3154942 RepID=UPI00344BF743